MAFASVRLIMLGRSQIFHLPVDLWNTKKNSCSQRVVIFCFTWNMFNLSLLFVVCLHYTYFSLFVKPYFLLSSKIIIKTWKTTKAAALQIINSIFVSPLLLILSHIGVTSLVNLSQKSLEKTRIVVSRCCIRSYVSGGCPARPKSLPPKNLRRKAIRV